MLPYNGKVLKRIRNAKKQMGLTAKQHRQNVADAFLVSKRRSLDIRNKWILLIDDVVTTGATVEACTHAQLFGEAEKVDVLALARGLHPQQLFY